MTSNSKTRKTSVIWDYFTRINMSMAKCDVCENKFSYRTSISNLKKHIHNKHHNLKSFVDTSSLSSSKRGPTNKRASSFDEAVSEEDSLDTKDRIPPARVPSPPVSLDGNSKEASNAAPSVPSVANFTAEIPAASTPAPSLLKKPPSQQPFKKIKLVHQEHDAPFTESYLEDAVSPFELKTANIRKSPPPRPNPRIYQDEGSHICSSCPCVAAQENEYDKIGKAWASELKLMSKEQQIFAKRAIAEIIFEGQLGGLSRHSVLIRQDNPTNEGEPFVIHENTEFLFEKSSQHATGI